MYDLLSKLLSKETEYRISNIKVNASVYNKQQLVNKLMILKQLSHKFHYSYILNIFHFKLYYKINNQKITKVYGTKVKVYIYMKN